MKLFVCAPQHFNNICVLARTLEIFGANHCYIYDPHRLIRPRYGKSCSRRLKKISAGAFFRIDFEKICNPLSFIQTFEGRTIATVTNQNARSLYNFKFSESDLIAFGSEGKGLPSEIIQECDERVTIPQYGSTQSFNLCVATGIIVSELLRQHKSFIDAMENQSCKSIQRTLPTS